MEELPQVEDCLYEGQVIGLELRVIEDVVDERQQVRAGIADVGDVAAALVAFHPLHVAHQQQLRETDDGVELGAQLVAHGGEKARLGLARDLRLAVRLLQFDRAPMGEVHGLFQQRRHGTDAEIATLLHDCEAGGDRLWIAIGDQLLHTFDRSGGIDHHRLARHQRRDRAAVVDVEPERLGELAGRIDSTAARAR